MKIIIDMPDIEIGTMQATIIKEWILELVRNKAADHVSPLRYARRVKFVENICDERGTE